MNSVPDSNLPTDSDTSLRFLFEQADIRGECVQLGKAYRDLLAVHQYAPGVARLLGEFIAAAVLLSSNLKFEGRLILQVRSEGQVPLLMAECDHNLHIRGIARGAQEATADSNDQLLRNGQLVITVDPVNGQRYQGITAMEGDSLARSLDAYFEQSEQLKTRLILAADGERAGGLLLQQLPAHIAPDEQQQLQQWEHASHLASTVTDAELLNLTTEQLLHRLYHQDPIRLFTPNVVEFQCNCSRERTRNALATLHPAEIAELLHEMDCITMDCEFCNQQYQFTGEDLSDILESPESKTLH